MGNQCILQKSPYFSRDEEEYYAKKIKQESIINPPQPRNFQNCRELSEIGRGNAQVFQAINSETNEIFAVKKLKCPEGNTQAQRKIENEAKILANLNHKNVVKYNGSCFKNGYLKIYMEFVNGGSIESMLNSYGRLDTKVAANFTRQVCKGLEYLHSHKIMHRDIKCANILVTLDGQVKLTDFGCAKEVLSVACSFNGTPGFMAPEVSL